MLSGLLVPGVNRTNRRISVIIFRSYNRRKFLHNKEKTRSLSPIHLFSLKNLPSKTGKSVASREFLGKVVGEQAVVPPDLREFLSGVKASKLLLY